MAALKSATECILIFKVCVMCTTQAFEHTSVVLSECLSTPVCPSVCMTMSPWTKNNSRLSGLSLLPSRIAHKLNSSPHRPSCHCTQTRREPSREHSGGGLFADPLINTLSICSSSPQFAHERLNRAHPPLSMCKRSPLSNCSVNLV